MRGAWRVIILILLGWGVLEVLFFSWGVPEFGKQGKDYEAIDHVNSDDRSGVEESSWPVLQSKHKIFLSHSGKQKEFVKDLSEDLEARFHFPFFDIYPSSLPKGEPFPKYLFQAAQQCEMAVVVVSEEYFTSKWPMIELNTFIQARSRFNPRLKILPLFFGLSINEVGDSSRQKQWFKLWKGWAKEDKRINAMDFQKALKELQSFNGFEFSQDMREIRMFRRKVVSSICKDVPPDIKWDDSHVQGRSSILEAFHEKIQRIQPSGKYGVRVIGFYGMGGIGKTTMCKILCNELLEFEGKVHHVELAASQSSLLKEVLKKLTSTSEEVLQNLNEGECIDILHKSVSWKQKTFLAIDNVWDDSKSIEHAKMFLQAAFHEGSVVMVTARSLRTLGYLGVDESHCFEVPELSKVDARNLFLYHAAKEKQFDRKDDNNIIDQCVARCYFQKSKKQGFHYLPLTLKVLGMHLGCLGNNPVDWLQNLPKVRDFNLHFPEENPVFSIIRLNFDRLSVQEQALFMDIALYSSFTRRMWSRRTYEDKDLLGWLSLVHRQKLEDTQSQLQRLKGKGLLEDVDISSQELSMHDLYREFAEMESQGKLNSECFKNRRWMYWKDRFPKELEITPSGRCWENLSRVGIEQVKGADDIAISSLQGIQWKYCSNVEVLKLIGLTHLKGVLNLQGLRSLRSLELEDLDELDGLEGLEDLNSLTYFHWLGGYSMFDGLTGSKYGKFVPRSQLGPLPASLKAFEVRGAILKRDVFAHCTNLCNLTLDLIQANNVLDFSNCTSLQGIELREVQGLQKLSGLAAGCLQSLSIYNCRDLSDILGLEHLVGLQHMSLNGNRKLEKLSNLGSLRQLRELTLSWLDIAELPNLSRLQHLHRLDLWGCKKLTTLEGVGHLPALRHLRLVHCNLLLRLPDLSKSTNLEELDLRRSGIELQEEDIQMLAKLPMLRPVIMDNYPDDIRLDVVKRKVLKYRNNDGIVEERDLESPPIQVHGYKFQKESFEVWPRHKFCATCLVVYSRMWDRGEKAISVET